MKISRKKFVLIFLFSAFVFQFISNSILGPEVGLFPANGDYFPGADSPIAWKSTLATILYPVKMVLVGPPSSVLNDPDPVPPILLAGFALYWTVLALGLYFLLVRKVTRKKYDLA